MVAPVTHHHTAHHHATETVGGSQVNQVISGALAGCLTRFLTQPFDVLKIRFQLQVEPLGGLAREVGVSASSTVHASKYTSLLQACRLIKKEEGLSAFWKGHNAGQLMSITYAVMQFWSYEQISKVINDSLPWLSQHYYVSSFVSGGIAGCVGTFFSMPFDVIRTRLVAQDHGSGYRNILEAVPIILRQEGTRGLFRGLGTTLVQIGPLVGGNFMVYNQLNDLTIHLLEPTNDHLPAWSHLLNGAVAGIISKAAVYPLDFIKKRLQVQGFESQRRSFGKHQICHSIQHCYRLTLYEEGLLGFYKGMTPTLLKSGMTTALYFSIYAEFKELLNKHS